MLSLMASKVRLFVEQPLGEGQLVPLSRDQAHYLFSVMRLEIGATISLINSIDGEWDATVVEAAKRKGVLTCVVQTKPLQLPPDLWLLFAPIRKERTAFIVEKATELGVARILPVHTAYTQRIQGVHRNKLLAHAIEATEQCGGTFVPEVAELEKLSKVLDSWPIERQLIFCDEARVGPADTLSDLPDGPSAIVIGPEGGFSAEERHSLRAVATTISLGPRILRADTAAVAALTLWQSAKGDW